MPGRCPVCGNVAATGSLCSVLDSDEFDITGAGSAASPHKLIPREDGDVDNLFNCGVDGASAPLPASLTNPPSVCAFHAANQSIVNNTLTTVALNLEQYDTDTMHDNCVDDATEILTNRGWLRYNELQIADEVLTLNHGTGLSEWQNPVDIHIHEARSRTMVLMEGRNHSSLTTQDHRWPVIRRRYWSRNRGFRDYERRFTTTAGLVTQDSIPIAARCADVPTTAKWDDDFVELVAWFWTEGSIMKSHGRPTNHIVISQSRRAHPGHCERISSLLHRMFGPQVDSFGRQGSIHDGVPRWKTNPSAQDCIAFTLNAPVSKLLRDVAPERIVSLSWLRELTSAQLELFIEVSVLGDGVSGPHGNAVGQKSQEMAESFQFAVLLSGRASSLRLKPGYVTDNEDSRFDGVVVPDMWYATQLRNTMFSPRTASSKKSAFSISTVTHDGIVWCPETPNGTWLARRNGRVYFTGNSSNNSRITFTTAGKYLITFNGVWNKHATGDRMAQIRKNGSDILGFESKRTGGADLYVGHSLVVQDAFVATDYVEARVQQTSGVALLLYQDNYSPFFAATKVGP